jgi:hypothetical protein
MKLTNFLLIFSIIFMLSSCADSKKLELNGQERVFQPYGWADYDEFKNDSIQYKVNVGNVFWGIVGFPYVTVFTTAWQVYEPIRVKPEYITIPKDSINTFNYN